MSGRTPTAHTSIPKIFTKPTVKSGLNSYNISVCKHIWVLSYDISHNHRTVIP